MTLCRVCKTQIKEFFSLGKMPLVNSFLRIEDIKREKRFDLSIGFCFKCYLVQLMRTVDPKELFGTYLYFSSVTKSIIEHSKKTAGYLIKRLKLTKKSLVIELGSNDGVHLQFYKEKKISVLGVDPAENVAEVANKKGIKTITEFFSSNLAHELVDQGIKADLIYGANVLAHVPEIIDFVKGVKMILKKRGSAVFESPYIEGLLENKFDIIYHEHVFYFSLIALKSLFKQGNLEIYDIEFISMQGGSLRIYIGHFGELKVSSRVKRLFEKEKLRKFDKIETYSNLNKRIIALKKKIVSCLRELKRQGKTIAAYGAPAKGIILLNFFGISKYLDFIVDKSPAKQGLYIPGAHMLICNPEKIIEEKPDYLLILAWNIVEEIVRDLRAYKKQGGKFIIPIPKIKII